MESESHHPEKHVNCCWHISKFVNRRQEPDVLTNLDGLPEIQVYLSMEPGFLVQRTMMKPLYFSQNQHSGRQQALAVLLNNGRGLLGHGAEATVD